MTDNLTADAAIYERGYRRYDGARTGVPGAIRTLVTHSVRAILGIGRSARYKIMPLAVIGFAFTPAIVFVGLAALLPSEIEENFLPSYAEYYGFISAALLLFAAFVAPELLCTDRRTGMLGVYLASPLNRQTYLLGKTVAITSILAIVTIGPPLLLLIALSLEDAGPESWSAGVGLGLRILAAGGLMSAFFAAISMAVSATTDRKGAATATTLGLLIGSAAVTNGLVEAGDLSSKILLGDLLTLPLELAFRIHGETGDWSTREVPTSLMILTTVGIIAACSAWVWGPLPKDVGTTMSSIPTQPPIGQSITAPGSEREGDGTVPPPSPSRSLPAILPNATVIVDNVSKSFGSLVAVSDVTFSVGPGVTALLGPNGAGKSTLLRVLCGLTPPSTGAIQVNGGNPRTEGWARRSIGLVPQQDGVFERDSLYDFVHLSAVLNGVPDPDAAVRVALDAVELAPDLDRPLGAFSKGMRQRAKIAAALVHRPSVMVLDEPLNGLDPKQRRQMITLFHQLGEDGYTVLVSSHVLDEVERFGSRVLVIAKGRLAAQGDFRAIRALMNDQPLTYRISCSDPRSTAAELIREGMVTGCTVTGAETVEITTADAAGFRHRLPAICSTNGIRLEELSPLDADLESVFRYLVGALTMTDNLDMPDTLNVSRTATGPAAPMQQRGPTVDHNVKTPGAFLALYRLVLRHQITRGRLVLFAVIGAISVALGWVIGRSGGNIIQDSTDFVSLFGLGLIVPVVALVLGSAALGTWVEDETLVYIWLRPVKRWVVALAATLASATVAVPVTVASMGAMAALGSKGDGGVIGGAVLASALGSLAYVALFVLAGLLVKRALLWGLVYVFIWEFFVARAGAGAARLSINSYAASILSRQSGIDIRLADRGLTTSYIVLGAVSLVAIALTTWRLSRANVA